MISNKLKNKLESITCVATLALGIGLTRGVYEWTVEPPAIDPVVVQTKKLESEIYKTGFNVSWNDLVFQDDEDYEVIKSYLKQAERHADLTREYVDFLEDPETRMILDEYYSTPNYHGMCSVAGTLSGLSCLLVGYAWSSHIREKRRRSRK